MALMVSLKAKLKACVGKYRTTLARLPRQKEAKPCSAVTRVKQLTMPAQSTLVSRAGAARGVMRLGPAGCSA